MKLMEKSVAEFLRDLGSAEPVPGGGSASALMAAVAASLYSMVVEVTLARESEKSEALVAAGRQVRALGDEFGQLVDADAQAYQAVRDAYRLPKSNDEEKAARALEIQKATRLATSVPLQLAEKCTHLMQAAEEVARQGRTSCISDAGVANFVALSAIMGALLNVETNLPSLKDEAFVEHTLERVNALQEQCRLAFDRLQQVVMERMEVTRPGV